MGQRSKAGDAADPDADFDVVHADILRCFPDLVADMGGDPQALAKLAGITPALLTRGRSSVGYRLIAALLERAATELSCPDFGMRLARLQGGRVFGPVSAVMKNSNTLGEALAYVNKHAYAHSLAAQIRLEPDRASRSLFVAHDILLERLSNKSQSVEHILLLGQLNAMEITGGRARVRRVHFRHQPMSPLSVYRRYFGCEVRFDQREDGVMFSERDLLCPIAAPDAHVFEAATLHIDTQFPHVSPPMQAQVRGVILQFIGTERCTNDGVAAELHMHPRTLHRRLRAEGKSFLEIKDEVRRDLAHLIDRCKASDEKALAYLQALAKTL